MSGSLDLIINQGATFKRIITIADSAGAPLNITGNVFRGQIRKRYTSTEFLAEFLCEITDPTQGKLGITLTDTETSLIPAGDWVYDVEWLNLGMVSRLIEGQAITTAEVTR